MTPERFRWCLQQLPPAEWTVARLARYLKVEPGTIRQMRNGRRPVPDNLEAWLEREALAAQEAAQRGETYTVATMPENWIEWRGKKTSERK